MDASVIRQSSENELIAFARGLIEPGADFRARLAVDAGDEQEQSLRHLLNAIAERVAADLREIARLTNTSSSSVAKNRFFLERIGDSSAAEADLVDEAVSKLDACVETMRTVAADAEHSLTIALEMGNTSAGAAETAHEVLAELQAVTATVEHFDRMVAELSTHEGGVEAGIDALRKASSEALAMTAHVRASSERIEEALTEVAVATRVCQDQMAAIELTASEQTAVLESLVTDAATVATAATATLRTVSEANDLQIGDLNSELHAVIGRYRIGTFVDRALEIGEAAALEVEAELEAGLARGKYGLEDLIEPNYRELRDGDVTALRRLFGIGPAGECFDPPKFGTTYDAAIDELLCSIVDRYTDENPIFTAMCVLDNNAFHVAYSRVARAAITGDPEFDRTHNRIKRIFADRTSLRCARVGLSLAGHVPAAAERAVLEASKATRSSGTQRPYLVQSYARDTGEVFNDLSLALYVRGIHYGALSIAYPAHIV